LERGSHPICSWQLNYKRKLLFSELDPDIENDLAVLALQLRL